MDLSQRLGLGQAVLPEEWYQNNTMVMRGITLWTQQVVRSTVLNRQTANRSMAPQMTRMTLMMTRCHSQALGLPLP